MISLSKEGAGMAERLGAGWKCVAGLFLLVSVAQTVALLAIYQELINIRVQVNLLSDLVLTIARPS